MITSFFLLILLIDFCKVKTQIEGFNINYKLINEEWISEGRDILVLLHEGLGSIPQWKNFPSTISNKLKLPVLIYERIGYGESDFWTDGIIKSQFLHNEALVMLPALIKKLGILNSIIIFGHSDGGTIALIHASAAMAKVKAVIVEAPHILFEEYSLIGIRKARELLKNDAVIQILNRYHQGRAAELIDKWTAHWLAAKDIDWDASQKLNKITLPLLLIQGYKDDFGTFAQIDNVAKEVKSNIIQVERIEDCGHIPHLEQQEKIINLTEDFINKI